MYILLVYFAPHQVTPQMLNDMPYGYDMNCQNSAFNRINKIEG